MTTQEANLMSGEPAPACINPRKYGYRFFKVVVFPEYLHWME
jgi:hypothetical protein